MAFMGAILIRYVLDRTVKIVLYTGKQPAICKSRLSRTNIKLTDLYKKDDFKGAVVRAGVYGYFRFYDARGRVLMQGDNIDLKLDTNDLYVGMFVHAKKIEIGGTEWT